MLNIDINEINNIKSKLIANLNFYDRYTKNTFPSIITNQTLIVNSFHVNNNDYIPSTKNVRCSTANDITNFAKSCLLTFNATGDIRGKLLGLSSLQSYGLYFFTELPPISPDIWDSHWLCIALGSTPTITSQSNTTPITLPFNYGNFDTILNFNNGIGRIIQTLNVADVFKVYDVLSNLRYKNVFSPLMTGNELKIEYWVSNYCLEGVKYRIYPNRKKVVTDEDVGTIKLISNYTGNAKVVWSDFNGTSITFPTTYRSAESLLKPFPLWTVCKKNDNSLFLDALSNDYWVSWDAFDLASQTDSSNILIDLLNRSKLAIKFTAQNTIRLQNNSYFYKKENVFEPLRYPGSNVKSTNTTPYLPSTVSISRENLANKFNFLKINSTVVDTNSSPNLIFENNLIQSSLDGNLSVSLEFATSNESILEIKLYLTPTEDEVQVYTAYVNSGSGTFGKTFTANYYDFVKWGSMLWYPSISTTPVSTSTTGDAYVGYIFTQASIGSSKPVILFANFNKRTGTAELKLNAQNFTSQPPTFRYASGNSILIRVKDSAGNIWKTSLPNSSGQWRTYSPSWDLFFTQDANGNIIVATPSQGNIQECVFEATEESYVLLHYLAPDAGYYPFTIPIPSIAYKAAVVSKLKINHSVWIGDFKTVNNQKDKIPYTPGALPFAREVFKVPNGNGGYIRAKDSWSDGNLNISSVSPYHLFIWGDIEACDNQIRFLADSFTAYTKQSSSRIRGIPVPTFLSNYWDSDTLFRFADKIGTFITQIMSFPFPFIFDKKTKFSSNSFKFNYFSWKGNAFIQKNFNWVGNCAIAMEATSRYIYANPSDVKAKSLVTQYLTYLKNDYELRDSIKPLTDILETYDPQSNYDNPYFAALIGRTALYGNLAGIDSKLTTDIIDICYRYINSQFVSSGTMQGSYSASQPNFNHEGIDYKEYFTIWQCACMEFLSLLVINSDLIIYPQLSYLGVLPSIEPTKVSQIKAAIYPKENLMFSDGNRQSIRHIKSQSGRTITLEYQMISQDDFEVLVDFWKRHGTSEVFQIPSEIPMLSQWQFDLYGQPSNWRMSQPFSLETVVATSVRGRYNTSITIIQN